MLADAPRVYQSFTGHPWANGLNVAFVEGTCSGRNAGFGREPPFTARINGRGQLLPRAVEGVDFFRLARLIPPNASATCDAEPRQSGLPVRSLAAVTFSRAARPSLIIGAKPSDLWHKRPGGRAAAGCSHRNLLILSVFARPDGFEPPTTWFEGARMT
jgi:hypothetical protein